MDNTREYAFTAKMAGTCGMCRKDFWKGDRIAKLKIAKVVTVLTHNGGYQKIRVYAHLDCTSENGGDDAE